MATPRRRTVVLGVTGAITIGSAMAIAAASRPATVSWAGHGPGLVAIVGVGLDACGDNNKNTHMGATGNSQNKVCYNSGLVYDAPQVGSVAFVSPGVSLGGVTGVSVASAGDAIGGSVIGVGASENFGVGQ